MRTTYQLETGSTTGNSKYGYMVELVLGYTLGPLLGVLFVVVVRWRSVKALVLLAELVHVCLSEINK